MSKAIVTQDDKAKIIESALIGGDIAKLTPEERVTYYMKVCESLGLNHMTKPFDYITLNGKLTLYARKDATEQLRTNRGISVTLTEKKLESDIYCVTAEAHELKSGRVDTSLGAVSVAGLRGEALANAYMKAETKAKRRVTLSICGLGLLDETEVDTIPQAVLGEPKAEPKPIAKIVEAQVEEPAKKVLKADDIPFDGKDGASSIEDSKKALVIFGEAMKECADEAAVKSCWSSFAASKPTTAEAGKAWKLRVSRMAELRGEK